MKARILFLAAALAVLSMTGSISIHAFAAEKAPAKLKATPKGGLLLEKTKPHAELVVEKDRSVTIHFYDDEMKPVAVTGQSVTVIAAVKGTTTKLDFEKKGDVLVSKTKLPEGEGYNVVVQFKSSAEAKPQNTRFVLDLHVCGGCQRAEYGCTCGH